MAFLLLVVPPTLRAGTGVADPAGSATAAPAEPVTAEPAQLEAAEEQAAETRSDKIAERLARAARVIDQSMATPDNSIPKDLLDRATCVIVIPAMKKAGFGIGARYGRGAVTCRRERGEGPWGPPSMVLVAGGSFGLQIGYTVVDLVLLVMNPEGIDDLLKSKFTLGGDASVAAGPVGRATTASTDARMGAKILAWSRSRGVFAGLELAGAVLKQDLDANAVVYGAPIEAKKLLIGGAGVIPEMAQDLVRAVDRHSPRRSKNPL